MKQPSCINKVTEARVSSEGPGHDRGDGVPDLEQSVRQTSSKVTRPSS